MNWSKYSKKKFLELLSHRYQIYNIRLIVVRLRFSCISKLYILLMPMSLSYLSSFTTLKFKPKSTEHFNSTSLTLCSISFIDRLWISINCIDIISS